ncbi:MAG: ATP-binding protein [Candidatus Limnocylindrales bacterium]
MTGPRRFIQIVAGPRQVGKSTLVGQAVEDLPVPVRIVSADEPALRGPDWIAAQWEAARLDTGQAGAVLVIDEVQKAAGWSESVKRLWDEDTRARLPLQVVLLGSAPLLVEQGLSESLAGRFEVIRVPHWSLAEMRAAFGITIDEYVFFGGYPGAAPLIDDEARWRRYVLDSLVETTISRDVLLLTRVDKPALLRRLFELGCRHSGQVLSYTKMLGQLHDAGNTTTLAHYLELLAAAGLLAGLPKFSGNVIRRRGSSPKLQVLNTALATAQSGRSFADARSDHEAWGRLVESAVGAHLANAAAIGEVELSWWREGDREVDFVLSGAGGLAAIEVKSGRAGTSQPGIAEFSTAFAGLGPVRPLLVGADGIPLERFLLEPPERWVAR